MLFTIHTNNNHYSDQLEYFHLTINKIPECKSILWNKKYISLFDIYDKHTPDYSIISIEDNTIIDDIIEYNNCSKNIQYLINIDNLKITDIVKYDDIFQRLKIPCKFYFSANRSHKNLKLSKPYINISNGANLNYMSTKKEKYFNIDKAIIISKTTDIKEYESSHHFISNIPNTKCDFYYNLVLLDNICINYNYIIFRHIDPDNIPEEFFNCISSGCKVYLDIENSDEQENANNAINDLLKENFELNYRSADRYKYDDNKLQNLILNHHSCYNRTKTLLSQLKNTYHILSNFDKLKENI